MKRYKPYRSQARQYYDILNSLLQKSQLLISEISRVANISHYGAEDILEFLEKADCISIERTEHNIIVKIKPAGLEYLHSFDDFEKKIQAMNLDIRL